MCGIVGYTGTHAAAPLVLSGLSRLAYRGYDSAGVAVTEGGSIVCRRAEGKLQQLLEQTRDGAAFNGRAAIGHTRWATHGAPSERNAHPHLSSDGAVAVVHNGIIENHAVLRAELTAAGISFSSETDTEVIPHLLATEKRKGADSVSAVRTVVARLTGAYSIGILFRDEPECIYAVRQQSPLVAARGAGGSLLASDVPALMELTRRVIYPEEGEIIRLTPTGITVFDRDGYEVSFKETDITWEEGAARKDGYPYFMEKEMNEVPVAVERTLDAALREMPVFGGNAGRQGTKAPPRAGERGIPQKVLREARELCFVGCGSAYHVGLAAQYTGERLLHIPIRVETASEYRYRGIPHGTGAVVIAVSQSGETADTLAAVREAKRNGVYTIGIVNVVGSAIAREADSVFYTQAGPEIAVATTKAFCAQLTAAWALLAAMLSARGEGDGAALTEEIRKAGRVCAEVCAHTEDIRRHAVRLAQAHDIFYIGRGADYAACMEGCLKLKEISYLHAEAYAAGELKHGTISLIERGVPVIGLLTQPETAAKTAANLEEVRSRGAWVLAIAGAEIPLPDSFTADCIRLPPVATAVAPLASAVIMQLLAYTVCRTRGLDPDMPRNLAKSVTVE